MKFDFCKKKKEKETIREKNKSEIKELSQIYEEIQDWCWKKPQNSSVYMWQTPPLTDGTVQQVSTFEWPSRLVKVQNHFCILKKK